MKDDFFIIGSTGHSIVNFRLDLIASLKNKFNLTALSQDFNVLTKKKLKKINVNYIPYGSNNSFVLKELKSLLNILKILKKKNKVNVLSYTLRANLYVGIASMINSQINHFPMITGLGGIFLSKDENFFSFIRYFLFFNFLKISLFKSKTIIFQNKDDQKFFKGINFLKIRSTVVPGSGVNTQNFKITKFPKKITFLMISRIIKYKGIENFFSVSKEISKTNKNVKFYFVGKSQKSFSLDKFKLNKNKNVSNIKFLNWKTKINQYYSNCSIYVLPSKREGMSRTILEAMSCGRPIITSNVPGCKQTVKDGYNGYIVKYNNNLSLRTAMDKFIKNPNLIKKFGTNSRKRVIKYYDVDIVNEKIFAIIKK